MSISRAFEGVGEDTPVAILDTTGVIIGVNAAWVEFAGEGGASPDLASGRGVDYLAACESAARGGDPFGESAAKGLSEVCRGVREGFTMEYPCHSPSEERWFLMQASRVLNEERVVVMHLDVTSARALARLESVHSAQATAALQATGMGRWEWDITEDVIQWDEATHEIMGVEGEGAVTFATFREQVAEADWAVVEDMIKRMVSQQEFYSVWFTHARTQKHIHVRGRAVEWVDGEAVKATGVVMDVTDRIGRAEARERLLEVEQQARQRVEEANSRLRFLAGISAALLPAKDRLGVAEVVVERLLDGFADVVLVAEADPEQFRMVWGGSVFAELTPAVERLVGLQWETPPVLMQAVEERAEYVYVEDIASVTDVPAIREMARRTGAHYALILALQDGTKTSGAISCYRRRPFLEEEISLALEVARRAGSAMAGAKAQERERELIDVLQRAVLPSWLPTRREWDVAAGYRPAEGVLVGGDFYDAFDLPVGGGMGVAVGDVAGHGLASATVMGQLRNGLRALALTGQGPAQVIEGLERMVALDVDAMATAIYAEISGSGELVWSSGGHLPLLVVNSKGSRWLEQQSAPPLGMGFASRAPVQRAQLERGDRVLFLTDGLVERKATGLEPGMEALQRVAEESIHLSAEEACEVILDRMLADRPTDDTCLVVLDVRPQR